AGAALRAPALYVRHASAQRLHEVDDRCLRRRLGPLDLLPGELRLEHRLQLAPVLVLEVGGVPLADEALDHLAGKLELGLLHVGRLDRLLDLGLRAHVVGEEQGLERERVALRSDETGSTSSSRTKRRISIHCDRCSATASRSDSSTMTNSPFATSQPLTSSSASTSRSWNGHHRFCLIGVPHSRCSVRNATSLRWVASASPIGMLTRPKLIDPFQIVLMGLTEF